MNTVDSVVEDYLERLRRAAAELPPDQRQELVEGIREHIAAARATGAAGDEAAARTMLDRLGDPTDIVAAAREDDVLPGDAYAGARQTSSGTLLELVAVVLLTAGSFVPVVGWLAGVVLLWASRLWRWREKVIGTLVVPFGPGGLLVFGPILVPARGTACTSNPAAALPPSGVAAPPDLPPPPELPPPPPAEPPATGDALHAVEVCTETGPPEWFAPVAFVVLVLACVVVAVWLLRVARRRAA